MKLPGLNLMTQRGALICGFYGYSNLGDEAMLAGMSRLLRRQDANFPLTVLTFNPEDTQRRHQPISTISTSPPASRLESIRRRFRDPVRKAMKENPIFILGGGDLLRDGMDRPVAQFWLDPMEKALKLKRRTALLGVSVGEIWKPETRELIPRVLNQVDLITVRDAVSKQKLEALGITNPVHVIPDLALQAVRPLAAQFSNNRFRKAEQPFHLGISVRWMSNRGKTVDYSYAELQKEIAAIADYAAEKHNAVVRFLPFQAWDDYYSSDDDDYIAILEILRRSCQSPNFVVHRYFSSLTQLAEVFGGLDLVIGMRLHSLIIASGMGIPVIAADYDPKVTGFMKEIGQSDYSIPLREFCRDRVASLLDQIMAQPQVARDSIARGLEQYEAKHEATQSIILEKLFR